VTVEVVLLTALLSSFIPVRGKSLGTAVYELVADRPEFCATCHLMGTRYMSFRRSSHVKAAACMDCHSEPGLLGSTRAHLAGGRYLYAAVTGSRNATTLQAEVSNVACSMCHPSYSGSSERVPHCAHVDQEEKCADCHGREMAHSLARRMSIAGARQ